VILILDARGSIFSKFDGILLEFGKGLSLTTKEHFINIKSNLKKMAGLLPKKADPFAFYCENHPMYRLSSLGFRLSVHDAKWMISEDLLE
jgi:hypothetical protein